MISDLWQKLSALYGSAFTKPQGLEVDPTGVWSLTLSSLSGDDIDYGFKKLVLAEQFDVFPPNPKQFRALCLSRRNKKALPSVGEAFNEAKNYFRCGTRINHKAILFCALKIGETDFQHQDDHSLFDSFKSIYEKVELALNQGLSLPRLPEPEQKKETDKNVGKNYLTQIKKILNKGEAR